MFFEAEGTDLFAYMVDDLRRCYGFADAQPYLEQELAAGRAALLLDGLDEVLGGAGPESADAAYRKVAAEVERLATRYPNAPIVVTCRRAGWRGGLSQFQTLEVLDFDWPQVQAFVSRWYADDPAKADALRETLAASLRMQTLAANPLLLSLIAIVYGRDLELPERRAELYHRCVDVLLKDWDAHRGIRRFAQFTADRKRDLLEEVAWHFHRTGRRYFAERELLELIEAFLPTIDLDAGHARAILDEIAAQYGLLKVQAHGWYGFLHLTLQEYFAAVAANERGRAAVAEVAAHRHDPWWEEVILLLAGRMADASPLLLALLGRDPDPHAVEPPRDEPLSADDDLFHGDLFLVTRCLVGVPRLRTPWLRARIMATVRDLLLGSPCRTVSERAARRLVEVGGAALRDELLSLVADEDVPIERRKAIVAAFGALGDTAAAPRLFAIMERHGRPGPITSDLVLALGGIGYTPVLPMSLRWLRDVMDSADPDPDAVLEAWVVVQAVSVLSDGSAKPALWRLVEHATRVIATEKAAFDKAGGTSACIRGSIGTGRGWVCFRILNDLVTVIGQVGDEEDIDPLFDLCRRGLADGAGASAIIALGGDAESRRLFDMLAAPDIDSQLFLGILRELRNLKSGRIAPRALTTLRDPGVPWQIRWHITELFDGCLPEACEATLARLLADEELDHRVKIGIAATLALGGDPAGVDHLRRGFDRETLPDALLSEHNGSLLAAGGTWKRVADALRHVEDTSVVPALRVRHQRALEAGDTELALDLDTALRHLLPAEFDRRQQWLATCNEGGQYAFADRVTPSMLPSAFHVIDVRRAKGWDTTDLIRKVGEIADDAWSAERLLQIVLSGPPVSHARDAEQAYNALDEVCRRARVRAFPNGRIVPVRG
ncbi:MAG: NACHT domain-containing protein [Actinomadura sp.]